MADYFEFKPELGFFDKDKAYRSKLGQILSIFLEIVVLFLMAWVGKEIWMRQEPQTAISDINVEDPPPVVLYPDTFAWAFSL